MIFLIEYNRPEGRLLELKAFPDRDRRAAENARLGLELSLLRRGVRDHEVVILEAESEAAIRRTHRRYFEDVREIASSTGA